LGLLSRFLDLRFGASHGLLCLVYFTRQIGKPGFAGLGLVFQRLDLARQLGNLSLLA
jgi:hypothetical protein